jgi:hypothetical protein
MYGWCNRSSGCPCVAVYKLVKRRNYHSVTSGMHRQLQQSRGLGAGQLHLCMVLMGHAINAAMATGSALHALY